MRILKLLARLHDAISDVGFLLGVAALGGIVLVYSYEITVRYFLNAPTKWATETVQNLLVFVIFFMVPHVTRLGSHVAVTILPDFVPPLRKPLKYFTVATGAAMCLFAAWISLGENIRQIEFVIVTEANYPIPKWWMSIAITYGFAGAALYFLRQADWTGALRPRSWVAPNVVNEELPTQ